MFLLNFVHKQLTPAKDNLYVGTNRLEGWVDGILHRARTE